jgi:hypothetical protein
LSIFHKCNVGSAKLGQLFTLLTRHAVLCFVLKHRENLFFISEHWAAVPVNALKIGGAVAFSLPVGLL